MNASENGPEAFPVGQETGGKGKGKGKPPRTFCTHHSACCGKHFHSLAAFDAHHTENGCDTTAVNRDGKRMLEVLTEEGYCGLGSPGPSDKNLLHPVTIWTRAGLEERRRSLERRVVQ